ncbi:MAG: hypothetical protein NTY35_12790 [Planctomycetota bacterium]|nr:hypothetical protein [Planctomycetota bacterium]
MPTDARTRIAAWVCEAAALADSRRIRVEERACGRSGWPPFEVVIAVEQADGWHERLVHRRLEQVTRLDVLGAWRGGDACCGP